MSISQSASLSQRSAGKPVSVRAQQNATNPDTAWGYAGVGVKVGATPPATFAGFAYYEYGGDAIEASTFWENATNVYSARYLAGVLSASSNRYTLVHRSLPLDSNYVAGRYLFAFMNDGAPAGGDAPGWLSTPLLLA
jgi:hypothetical protein